VSGVDQAAISAPRQMRLNLNPLLVAQPKQIPAHDPDPLPKTNQNRIVRLEPLMSFDPSRELDLTGDALLSEEVQDGARVHPR
jgi:hypothetical protein